MSHPASSPHADPAHAAHVPRGSLPGLALGALGIVFGDIGTSPLYSLQECMSGPPHGVRPDVANLMGVLSLIFWSLTLVVTVKYLGLLMRADNRGEGGIMALLALLPERLRVARPGRVGVLGLLVIAGASLLYGDGIITPAISVLSAVEGLSVVTDRLRPFVVPLTCLILVALFAVQRRGTGKLGAAFGPIMLLWFLAIGALGARQIVLQPQVLAALSPHHAARFFAAHGLHGVRILGAVVLTVTGGEALYADMGHFGRRPIQAAWLVCAFPALLLCYFGQGALLITRPEAAAQPFYSLVPAGAATVALVVLATAATVIASQALISGVFSLTRQAMQLGYFPRVVIRHTSGDAEGQIYVPILNWGLAAGCIGLVLWAGHSSRLAAAFGLAVSGTMALTSVVFYAVLRESWGWPRRKALPILVGLLALDIPFLVANFAKFFQGGYLPFAVGLLFVVIMVTWRRGRGLLHEVLAARTPPIRDFLRDLPARIMGRVPGAAVCMSSHADRVPPVLMRMVGRFRVVHETVILLTVKTEPLPAVPVDERAEVEHLGDGFHRVLLRYGYMQAPDVPAGLHLALSQAGLPAQLPALVYFLGRETFVATDRGQMGRASEAVFALLSRNASDATAHFGLPPEQVVELGDRIDL